MAGSRDVTVFRATDGTTRSEKNCGSLTTHGYFGIEAEVITRISAWLDTTTQTSVLK